MLELAFAHEQSGSAGARLAARTEWGQAMIVFKPRGKTIQLVRQDQGGEGGSESLGTLKAPSYAVEADLTAKLTPEELRQATEFGDRALLMDRIAREHAVYSLPETLRLVTEWLRTASSEEAQTFVDEIRTPFGRLRKHVAKLAANESVEPQD